MTIAELVGFLITVFVLVFSLIRRMKMDSLKERDPEEYQRQMDKQEQILREYLGELVDDVKKTPPPPPPMVEKEEQEEELVRPTRSYSHTERQLTQDTRFTSSIENRRTSSRIEDMELTTNIKEDHGQHLVSQHLKDLAVDEIHQNTGIEMPSKAKGFLEDMDSKKNLLIAYEIFGPPVGMRSRER